MKRTIAISIVVLLACRPAPAPTYTIPVQAQTFDLLGSEFSVNDLLSGYFAGGGSMPNSHVYTWGS